MNDIPIINIKHDDEVEIPKPEDLDEWIIVHCSSGRSYLGKRNDFPDGSIMLKPAYRYTQETQIGPQGLNSIELVLPLGMKVGGVEARVDATEPFEPLRGYTAGDRKQMIERIRHAEEVRKQIRAQQSGIQMPQIQMPTDIRRH